MPETENLFNEVAQLRDQVEDMAKSVSALTRQSGIKGDVLDAMAKDPLLAQVFQLVDGRRTQKDILDALRASGVGGSQATVSRKLDQLVEDWDLVRPTTRTAGGTKYVHTSLAKDLRIVRALEKTPAKKTTKKSAPAKGSAGRGKT